ncbi:hypothetical protein MTsDn5_08080 [Alteromonas gracilis]|uniref:hypothetical protein n=1 Tax=Alteromonas gracilis TaxID=1479524 RepID=UPI0036F3CE49
MSKSLKQMAYDTIEAHQETIADLRTQLAKANERVKELEGQLQLTMLTTHEASFESDYGKKRLNKFAIEKKLKALNDLLEEIQCSVVVPKRYEQFQEPYLEGIKHCIQFIECQQEQLRKEQSND